MKKIYINKKIWYNHLMDKKFYDSYFPILFKHSKFDEDEILINPHVHPSLEIVYCAHGMIEMTYWEDNTQSQCFIENNSFFLIKPNVVHAQRSLLPETDVYCLEIKNNLAADSFNIFNSILNSQLGRVPEINAKLQKFGNVTVFHDTANILNKLKRLTILITKNLNDGKSDYFYVEYYIKLLDLFLAIAKCSNATNESIKGNLYIRLACAYISKHFHESDLSIEQISKAVNISVTYLQSLFKKTFNKSIKQYVNEVRIKNCISIMESINMPIEQIALKVGYKTYSSLYKEFVKIMNTTPKNYRNEINNKFFEIQHNEAFSE